MTILQIKGDLNIIKGTLRQKWGRLTRDGWHRTYGKSEIVLGRYQKHSSRIRQTIKKALP
jgi:uncharacterized protein YjbJ (UPF0337 family)